MEISLLKVLINSISELGSLSSSKYIKSEPIQSYHQKIVEALKLLRHILNEIVDSEIASDEKLNEALKELDAVVNEVTDLMESWQQMTSKLYFVFQIEPMTAKMQKYGVVICGLVNSLLQPLSPDSLYIRQCMQMFQLIVSEQISDIIKESVRYVQENTLPSSESLLKIGNSLSLITNQELLLEAIALEQVKTTVKRNRIDGSANHIDHLIALVRLMHDSLTKIKQSQVINRVPVPAHFFCPLSLELMSDPVMVASGQTYERAYIRRWLDQGLMVCPKSHQTLSNANLIPNYTVKELISNWCELHKINLPDSIKSVSSNQSSVLPPIDCSAGGLLGPPHAVNASRINGSVSPESVKYMVGLHPGVSLDVNHKNDRTTSPLHFNKEGRPPQETRNGLEVDVAGVSLVSVKDGEVVSDDQHADSDGKTLISTSENLFEACTADEQCQSHNQSASISTISTGDYHQGAGDENKASQLSGGLSHESSEVSSDLAPEASSLALAPAPPCRETDFSSRLSGARSRSNTFWRRPSAILFARMASSPASVTRPELAGVATQVQKLIEGLQSGSGDLQRAAAADLRLLAKHSMDNRIVIANCGAISHLVHLLHSMDLKTQENAVTALLNLSINDNNKISIANEGSIDPLIHVLRTGNVEAKENSAATLFSLSVIEENKVKIGRSGAIIPLVEFLGNGTPRGKKDAATALFNLSIFHENKVRIVQAGAVKHLVELMDPAAGMVDKAVAVLANLSTIAEGRNSIGHEGGIPILVEVVELGSSRGKENAAATLLQLCTNSAKFCAMALQEGVVPPLVALSKSGTPRAKEKAHSLLTYFRSQRRGNARRA